MRALNSTHDLGHSVDEARTSTAARAIEADETESAQPCNRDGCSG